jgi:hypothetical protein
VALSQKARIARCRCIGDDRRGDPVHRAALVRVQPVGGTARRDDLRDRISLFARALDQSLHGHFPALIAAPEQVILLIIAKGVEQSGLLARGEIEQELGIILPR